MSSAIAFASERALPEEFTGHGVGELLDTVASPMGALPCRVGDADLWFAESPAELEQAKTLCAGCPVRAACLSGALNRGEPWGVWGGEIFERGVIVARKRPRGRPRKNANIERPAAVERSAERCSDAASSSRSAAA